MAILMVCDACGECFKPIDKKDRSFSVHKKGDLDECKDLSWSQYVLLGDDRIEADLDLCERCYSKVLSIVLPDKKKVNLDCGHSGKGPIDSRENPPC